MSKEQILIVEDEGIVAQDIQNSLKNLGYHIAGTSSTGEEAVSITEQINPDLVLMDIMLAGEMDGIAAAEKIREQFDIPVIYLTAYTDSKTLQRAKLTGPYAFLSKPFEERELHASIEVALYKHKMEKKLKESEEQLRQSQKMEAIGRMAGGIAHDFNNMLTSILGFSTLIHDQIPEGDPMRNDTDEILRIVERASGLTKQLLSFSRSQTLPARPLDLNKIIHKVTQLLRRTLPDTVKLIIDLSKETAGVKADSNHVHQIIMNLTVNAWDAMPSGGTLSIRTSIEQLTEPYEASHTDIPPDSYTVLRISDTGTGMSEHVREHAFEPFFTTKERGKGTGLGLSTAYGIIHQYHGFVDLKTERGHGTEITMFFPHIELPKPKEKPALKETMPRGTETILLVEDEDLVISLAQRILTSLGYTILTAQHGVEALAVSTAYKGEINLMITDLIMPEMGGDELAQHMAKERPAMKLIFISGYTDGTHTLRKTSHQEIKLLEKPFTPKALAQTTRLVLDTSQG